LVGSDGGFLVPPQFSNKLFERVYQDNDLLRRTDQYTVGGNSMVFPRNAETSRATGSRWGGVRAYWLGEGSQGTRSAPTFGKLTMNLHKLMCLGVATEELLNDSGTALEQYLFRVFSDEITFLVGDSLINGTGAGQPLGVLNSGCLVSVAKEAGQAAATLNTQNIVKMWARMWAPSRSSAVWLINQDVEPSLHTMTLGIGTAGIATYMPPGGLSQSPYATLLGRPVMPTEFNATLGTQGDIILADLSQMCSLTKGGGMMNATSIHFYFDTDQQAFRVTFRLDAQPWWASALTPFKGTATQSCFVALDTRS
jgi:HK97 family phage major capsid protein